MTRKMDESQSNMSVSDDALVLSDDYRERSHSFSGMKTDAERTSSKLAHRRASQVLVWFQAQDYTTART